MRNFLFLVFSFFAACGFAQPEVAVTYDLSGGRLGDNLISYLHAQWLSYQYDVPLIYRRFEYSAELCLHRDTEASFDQVVELQSGDLLKKRGAPTLYVLPYFPEDPHTLKYKLPEKEKPWAYFEVDWKDEGFRKIARKAIEPIRDLQLISPPDGRIGIAIHVRNGGGFDDQYAFNELPLKFPPLRFYVKGLQEVVNLFGKRPLYCYLFTDAKDPESIVRRLRRAVGRKTDIIFDYRKTENRHDANVLEDFFSLFNFDALIRSQSSFSVVPSLLKDYAAVYSPVSYQVKKTLLMRKKRAFIDQIEFTTNEAILEKLLRDCR